MTLAEYRAWLDGMIAATGDERLKLAREKLAEVAEPAPVFLPLPRELGPPPYVPPLRTGEPSIAPNLFPTVTCVTGMSDPNIRCWNGAMQ